MTDLTALKGIGDKNAALYGKLGINTVEDAVFYFPRDYVTYEKITDRDLAAGSVNAFEAVIVKRPTTRRVKRLSITSVMLSAHGIPVSATWFNMPYLSSSLKAGTSYVFRGMLEATGDHYSIRQPQIFSKEQYEKLLGHINPVYALTKGLTNNSVTKTVKQSFDFLGKNVRPELYDMHFPKDERTLRLARETLVYDEFLLFILRLRLLKKDGKRAVNSFNMIETAECERIIEKLPYRLTNAQLRVWSEIKNDLCSVNSMRRLVQGDVGSGKTILSMLAAIMTALNGYQCAIMAPTEILAGQHFDTLKSILKTGGISLDAALLTGSMTASAKKNVRSLISEGRVSIIIGTHALFQEKVEYNNLALVITDEQHRFGVDQRTLLSSKNKNDNVHVLVMSATPIPRTLALIVYGDLNISIVDEVPAHKLPIKNAVVGEEYRKKAYEFMKKEIEAQHQVYVICPLIEASEGMDAKNVEDTAKELTAYFDDSVKIGVMHGQMPANRKQKVMDDFANNCINILVSTTVVEVGVNVPNATVMLIEDANRFGLAALHQLRGRIGRGSSQSYCIFMSSSKESGTMKRLEILAGTNDGFKIAEEDLKMRGPGDMFGIRQSGDVGFRLGDIYTDAAILKKASDEAARILEEDPDLINPINKKYRMAIEAANDIMLVGRSI